MHINYLSKLINFNDELNYSIFKILSARGFLLDYNDNRIFISDNSYDISLSKKQSNNISESISDKNEIEKLLTTLSIGYLENNEIMIARNADLLQLYNYLFSKEKVSILVERRRMDRGHSWNYDFSRSGPPKVATMDLEPYIARYIKAISAADVWTTFSCQGYTVNHEY